MFNVAVSPGLVVWSERVRKDLQKRSTYRMLYREWIYPTICKILFFPKVYLFLAFFLCLLIGEIVLPTLAQYTWPNVINGIREQLDKPGVYKVLFLGNVELLDAENNGPVQTWEADRYIEQNFNTAVDLVQPDLVLIVGDLFPLASPRSREAADSVLRRFDRIFKASERIKTKRQKFALFLGRYDRKFLNVACQPECTDLVESLLVKHLISTPCQLFTANHLQTRILVRRFYGDAPDAAKCPGNITGAIDSQSADSASVRVVIQQSPILHPSLAILNPTAFNVNLMPLDMADQVKLRDFAPNLVVSSRAGNHGILFCTNCLTLGAGGLPASPQMEWMTLNPGFEPITFRLPTAEDGGSRGGTQPHLFLPPVSYSAQASMFMYRSKYTTQPGFAFGIINPSSSEMTYFVLWNHDRSAVIIMYTVFLSIASFRLFLAASVMVYLKFLQMKRRKMESRLPHSSKK